MKPVPTISSASGRKLEASRQSSSPAGVGAVRQPPVQSGFNAALRRGPNPIPGESLLLSPPTAPFCLRTDHPIPSKSTSLPVHPTVLRTWAPERFTLGLGSDGPAPGNSAPENQTAGPWEAAARPDQCNPGPGRAENVSAQGCG